MNFTGLIIMQVKIMWREQTERFFYRLHACVYRDMQQSIFHLSQTHYLSPLLADMNEMKN